MQAKNLRDVMKTLGWHCQMSKQDQATNRQDPDTLLESTMESFRKAKEGVEVVIKSAKTVYAKMTTDGTLSDKGRSDLKELQKQVRENGFVQSRLWII